MLRLYFVLLFGLVAILAWIVTRFRKDSSYQDPFTVFTDAIHGDPQNALVYIKRGDAYFERAQYDDAIKDYTEAIKLGPTSGLAYVERGIAHVNKRDYPLAIQDFAKAIEFDPLNAVGYANRANACQASGDDEQAAVDLRKAQELLASSGDGNELRKQDGGWYITREWYYTRDRITRCGPVSYSQLQNLIKLEQLWQSELVWTPGAKDWARADAIQGLFPAVETRSPDTIRNAPLPSSTSDRISPPAGLDSGADTAARADLRAVAYNYQGIARLNKAEHDLDRGIADR